jgi:hypothetical protein
MTTLVGMLILIGVLVILGRLLAPIVGRWLDLILLGVTLVFAMPGGVASRVWPQRWWTGPGQAFLALVFLLGLPWAISGIFVDH